MRAARITSAIAALSLAWGLSACDQDLAGINENPNAPTDVGAPFLLPQVIQTGVSAVLGSGLNMNHTGLWAQHFAKIQYANEDRYEMRPETNVSTWQNFYTGPLKDISVVIEKGQETNRPNHTAVGLIMKSWIFGVMTDLWGDVPYSDALNGDKEGGTLTPAYDAQSAVYAGLLADLEAAVGMIDEAGVSFGSEDLIYKGNMARWRMFANSLRMRLAMRLSAVDPATAEAEFAAAYTAGGFASAADMALLQYLTGAPNQNPIHVNWQSRDDHSVSKTLVDMMLANADPRLPIYAEENADGEYVGMQNGLRDGHGVPLPTISRIGNKWREEPDAPAVLMSYAELLFLQAEAAQRGWISSGDPQALYEAAVTASMEQYGIDAAETTAYLAGPAVAWDSNAALERIAIQKWLALYMNGPEAYAEWRRTGYPAISPGPNAILTEVIRRLEYPDIEQSLNKANLDAAVSRQGGAGLTDRVWWDVQ